MATERIQLNEILAREEREDIDSFCDKHRFPDGLPAVSAFLEERFGVSLVTDPDIVAGFLTDSSNLPGNAQAVARPTSERECAIVVRACHAARIPFTVSAGRSSLTGSATAAGGAALAMVNMLAPPAEVDVAAATVRAPVGVILEDLRKDVTRQSGGRLQFPVNPTSRTDAAVGGAIACNASGFTPGEKGAMRAWVDALDVVLPDGRGLRTRRGEFVSRSGNFVLVSDDGERLVPVPRYVRPPIKNASGPYSTPDGCMDVVDLFVGSEGLFGVVTGCALRLDPTPDDYLDLFFSLSDEPRALAFREYVAHTIEGGVETLSALEYFGRNCRRFMEHETQLFKGDDQVAVYVQVPLLNCTVEEAAARWLDILAESDCGINDEAVLLLDNERDRAVFLEARHSMPANAVETVQRRGTFTIMTDTVVPPEHFAEFLEYTHARIGGEGIDYLCFGHLGDCHLHFTLLPEKEQVEAASVLYDEIIAKSAECGGVYSGEHGTGKRKRGDFLRCYGPDALEQVKACKAALDPEFLLNRGNVIEFAAST